MKVEDLVVRSPGLFGRNVHQGQSCHHKCITHLAAHHPELEPGLVYWCSGLHSQAEAVMCVRGKEWSVVHYSRLQDSQLGQLSSMNELTALLLTAFIDIRESLVVSYFTSMEYHRSIILIRHSQLMKRANGVRCNVSINDLCIS